MLKVAVLPLLTLFCIAWANLADIQVTTYDGVPANWQQTDPSPFVRVGEKYYLIESTKWITWFEAAHICRRHNAQLISIESAAEMDALSNYLLKQKHITINTFWTSGNDLDKEGHFYWLGTGNAIVNAKWSPHQPDNGDGNENCVFLWKVKNEYSLNDVDCKLALSNYICQANDPKTLSFTIW